MAPKSQRRCSGAGFYRWERLTNRTAILTLTLALYA